MSAKRRYVPRTAEQRRESRQRYQAKLKKDLPRYRLLRQKQSDHNAAKERALRADPQGWALANIKSIGKRCRKADIPFDICAEDLQIPLFCPVLGVPLVLGRGRLVPNSPSVDRLIPSLGYVRGNVCVISWRANRLKSDCVSPAELRAVANYIERSKQ